MLHNGPLSWNNMCSFLVCLCCCNNSSDVTILLYIIYSDNKVAWPWTCTRSGKFFFKVWFYLVMRCGFQKSDVGDLYTIEQHNGIPSHTPSQPITCNHYGSSTPDGNLATDEKPTECDFSHWAWKNLNFSQTHLSSGVQPEWAAAEVNKTLIQWMFFLNVRYFLFSGNI